MTQSTDIMHQGKKRAFLAAFSECGVIVRAAELAEIDRHAHYRWLADDPDYARAFEAAEHVAAERLEQEARRRAVEGVNEPVFWQGQPTGVVKKYSDVLLIFLLKGALPHKYRDNAPSMTVNNALVQQQSQSLPSDPAELARIARVLSDPEMYARVLALADETPPGDGVTPA